ncbi:MAG: hypothetical protein H0Z32_10460 [Bacillaceae bacterium]|nr:hypothetical protein [Bacillaceae bacterium]
MKSSIYFSDNFFSAGKTDIFNENKEKLGWLDLQSAFSSSVDVLDQDGNVLYQGHFPFLSNRWRVTNGEDHEIGKLYPRVAFFAKKYEYDACQRATFTIESEAFSKEYQILDETGKLACHFKKISGFFESSAFQLTNYTEEVPSMEWVAVVMGINAVEKRRRRNAGAAGGGGAQ